MKRRAAAALFGIAVLLPLLSGCGRKNEIAKAAEESDTTEKEGNGGNALPDEEPVSDKNNPEEDDPEKRERIAILFPGRPDDKRWAEDAFFMQSEFMESGYDSIVLYADGDADLQIQQVTDSIAENTLALVISPVDPYALSECLESMGEAGIPVFDYNELIMNTADIQYFITFDMRLAGRMMADRLIKDLSLDKLPENEGVFCIEYKAGRPDRVDDLFLFNSLKERLEEKGISPHLMEVSEGERVDIYCVSGEEETKSAMEAVLEDRTRESGADSKESINEKDKDIEDGIYLITSDNHVSSIQGIADGVINASVFMDNRILAGKCAGTVITYLSGEDPEVSNYGDYDNGVRLLKTITCEPEIIDISNYQILIDDGYFSDQEIVIPAPTGGNEEQSGDETESSDVSPAAPDTAGAAGGTGSDDMKPFTRPGTIY